MDNTWFTVGGFCQTSVTRSFIEQSGSAEIGLTRRFLWLFPQPTYSRFNTFEAVDAVFTDSVGKVNFPDFHCY